MLQVWVERAPKDLGTGIDLHIVDDEDEILNGGRIIAVEFKGATTHDAEKDLGAIQDDTETSETVPATITVEKWKYEIVEYSDPGDWPED
jgi:hypothetical protein